MALKKTITHAGVEIANCYIRVRHVAGDKNLVTAEVAYQSASESPAFHAFAVGFNPSLSGGNFIAQAYDHLKTLPQFVDAADC